MWRSPGGNDHRFFQRIAATTDRCISCCHHYSFLHDKTIAKKHLDNQLVKTNVESLIGKHVIVSADIDNLKSTGQVLINGVEWTARSKHGDTIETGTEVVIDEISGVKAIVEKAGKPAI